MKQNNFYIGFGTFEKFLDAVGAGKTIYLSKSCTTRPAGAYGISLATWNVTAAAVAENVCHYWQMRTGSYQTVGGNILSSKDDYDVQCERRTESALRALRDITRECRFKTIEGLISFPSDLQILEGATELLKYDKETNQFSAVIENSKEKAAGD